MPPPSPTPPAHTHAGDSGPQGKPHRPDIGPGVMILLLFGLLPCSFLEAQGNAVENPNRVKAAFLRNFAHYVTWPATAFENDNSPWRIGVLGNADFGEVVKTTLKGRTEQDRPFEIHCANSLVKLPPCQIVFIAFKDADRRRAVLSALKDKPVLTVGDSNEILQEGAIVRFQLGDRIQMSVNLDQARIVALGIQTKMLEVSSEVLENGVIKKMR